jgi:hypothetical protein
MSQNTHLKAEKAIRHVFVHAVVILYLQLQSVPQLAQTEEKKKTNGVGGCQQSPAHMTKIKRAGKGAPVKDIQGLAFKSALRRSDFVSPVIERSATRA